MQHAIVLNPDSVVSQQFARHTVHIMMHTIAKGTNRRLNVEKKKRLKFSPQKSESESLDLKQLGQGVDRPHDHMMLGCHKCRSCPCILLVPFTVGKTS